MAVGGRVLQAAGVASAGRLARVHAWWEQEHVFGYGLILPAFVLIGCLVAYPFAMALYFSLSDYWVGSPGQFVGFGNYREILGNEVFRQTVANSFLFTAIALTGKTVLGVWLALLLQPVLAVVILLSTIFTFNDVNIVYVLTRGGPVNTTHLFATYAYQIGLQGGNLGQGAAISLFMLPTLGLVVFFQLRYIRRE